MTTSNARSYWNEIKSKAAHNLATVSAYDTPEKECEIKKILEKVLRHGTCAEAAEAIVEASEWVNAHLQLRHMDEMGIA